jgi:hypothetical protein
MEWRRLQMAAKGAVAGQVSREDTCVRMASAANLLAALAASTMIAAAPTRAAAAAPRYEMTFITGGRLSKRLPMAVVRYSITPGQAGSGHVVLTHRLLPKWTTTVGKGPFPSASLARVDVSGRPTVLCNFQELRVGAKAPTTLEFSYASKTGSC